MRKKPKNIKQFKSVLATQYDADSVSTAGPLCGSKMGKIVDEKIITL